MKAIQSRAVWLAVGLLALAAGCRYAPTNTPPATPTATPTITLTETGEIRATATPAPVITDTPVQPTEDRSAKVLALSTVRRLTPVVWAGPAAPLPEVASDDAFELQPGGMITTDQSGEAEVSIEDCLKIYLYQGSNLIRNTCRKTDQESGLAVCSTAGMISVINQCLSQVVLVQTPNSEIVTHGTEFTVLYDPQEELTVVQVLEGSVAFQPVLAGVVTAQPAVEVQANNLIFTRTRQIPTSNPELPERQILPLTRWELLRGQMASDNPYVDLWMESVRQSAVINRTTFPQILARPTGTLLIEMPGDAWRDPTLQTLVSENIPWLEFVQDLWPEAFIKPQLVFPGKQVDDARFLESVDIKPSTRTAITNRGLAQRTITILALRGNANAEMIVKRLGDFLVDSGFRTNVLFLEAESLRQSRKNTPQNSGPVMIITLSGPYFEQ